MNKRLELHEILCGIINITEPNGDRHVYFNPPVSKKMKYPAIVYSIKNIDRTYASDAEYKRKNSYELMLIDRDLDSEYVDKILELPYCSYNRHYIADNLSHDVFNLYY